MTIYFLRGTVRSAEQKPVPLKKIVALQLQRMPNTDRRSTGMQQKGHCAVTCMSSDSRLKGVCGGTELIPLCREKTIANKKA